jgi:hypothetical protein
MKLCGMHERFEKMNFCEKDDDYKMIIKPSYMLPKMHQKKYNEKYKKCYE